MLVDVLRSAHNANTFEGSVAGHSTCLYEIEAIEDV